MKMGALGKWTKKLVLMGLVGCLMTHAVPAWSSPEIKVDDQEFAKDEESSSRKEALSLGKLHIYGYGEVHFNGNVGPTSNEVDLHRFVLGFGYDFTDKILFRSEVEFEHNFEEQEIEYAYIDFLVKKYFNVRAGVLIIPFGITQSEHEPPVFNGVERPLLDTILIPTTWWEAGAGFYGAFGKGFDYQLYVTSSLSAAEIDSTGAIDRSIAGSNGLRGGRGETSEAPGRDIAVSGRLQYKGVPGLRLGTSFYLGNTGQGKNAIGGAFLTMIGADARYTIEGFDFRANLAYTHLGDAANLNNFLLANDPTFTDFAATSMLGWNLEVAYNLFHHAWPSTTHKLIVFTRYEDVDTNFKMPTGFVANPVYDRNVLRFGLTYLPIENVAVKFDYGIQWNQANGGVDDFNFGIGYYF